MQKIALFFLAASLMMASCAKNVKQALSYSVTNDVNDSIMADVFIPDTGTYSMNVRVKFLTGYYGDNVKLVLTGLPSGITVSPDTFTSAPTFDKAFVFRNVSAPQGVYPVTVTAYTETVVPQSFNFNVHVIPADCAALYWGNLSFRNVCNTRSYNQTAIGVSTGTTNTLVINNFAGYGVHCNVNVLLNCDNDSVHIAKADYGNGVVLSGVGIFNADSMIISYNAVSVPTGGGENCTVVYKRQ